MWHLGRKHRGQPHEKSAYFCMVLTEDHLLRVQLQLTHHLFDTNGELQISVTIQRFPEERGATKTKQVRQKSTSCTERHVFQPEVDGNVLVDKFCAFNSVSSPGKRIPNRASKDSKGIQRSCTLPETNIA